MVDHPMAQPWVGWQPIETARKDETRILVANADEVATAQFTNGRFIISPMVAYDDGMLAGLDFVPTHWAPCPEPPANA